MASAERCLPEGRGGSRWWGRHPVRAPLPGPTAARSPEAFPTWGALCKDMGLGTGASLMRGDPSVQIWETLVLDGSIVCGLTDPRNCFMCELSVRGGKFPPLKLLTWDLLFSLAKGIIS